MSAHPVFSDSVKQVQQASDTTSIPFMVGGMTCGMCAQSVERALSALPGVQAVRVNAATHQGQLQVIVSQTEGIWPKVVAAVEGLGFSIAHVAVDSALSVAKAELRAMLWRWALALFGMMQVMMYSAPEYFFTPEEMGPDTVTLMRWAQWMITTPVLIFSGQPMMRAAWEGLRHGRISMDLPAAIGLSLAYFLSAAHVWLQSGAVWFDCITMYLGLVLGARWLLLRSRVQALEYLAGFDDIVPKTALRLTSMGDADEQTEQSQSVAVADLAVGDRVLVQHGERFPGDGLVQSGQGWVDEAILTGEAEPLLKLPGSKVVAGSRNLGDDLIVQLTAVGDVSALGQIKTWLVQGYASRPPWSSEAQRLAPWVLWTVLIAASLSTLAWAWIDPSRALMIGVTVLIVTCPCALSLAAPLAALVATRRLGQHGVLVRDPEALPRLAEVTRIAFDKTGTLTEVGGDAVSLAWLLPAAQLNEQTVVAMMAAQSRHPLAQALYRALQTSLDADDVNRGEVSGSMAIIEQPGQGMAMQSGGYRYRLGSKAWCGLADVVSQCGDATQVTGSEIWVSRRIDDSLSRNDNAPWSDAEPMLHASFQARLMPDVIRTLKAFRGAGLKLAMISGDRPAAVAELASVLAIEEADGGLAPDDKMARIKVWQAAGDRIAMVGDGVNDAAAMRQADVSFAMAHAAQLAAVQADMVCLQPGIGMILEAYRTAQALKTIVRQNLLWAAAYNLVMVPFACLGWVTPLTASLGMALSSVMVVANSARLSWSSQA